MNLTKSEIVFLNSSRGNDSEKWLWRQESGVEFQRNMELFLQPDSRHSLLREQNDEVLNEFSEKAAGTLRTRSSTQLLRILQSGPSQTYAVESVPIRDGDCDDETCSAGLR